MRGPSPLGSDRFLRAGGALALCEGGLVLATERELFLSSHELLQYLGFALAALMASCMALGVLGALALSGLARGIEPFGERHARRVRNTVGLLAWPLFAWLLFALSTGRRLRALQGRELAVVLGAALLAWLLAAVLARAMRARDHVPRRRLFALGFGLLAAGALVVDMYVLRRLYPPLHIALGIAAASTAVVAAALLPARAVRSSSPRTITLVALAVSLLAFKEGLDLSRAPNTRFAVAQSAPLSGKLLRALTALVKPKLASETAAAPPAKAPTAVPAASVQAGVDLRGQDVLLITVDALRADCLAAYGGRGLTPQLDALARESAVFARAYTPTPHTSYALTSMMTGKFLQPLLALTGDHGGEHPTLPELLRHNGYRTAAFYPPAIFFVDQERFGEFESRQLGFEYVKAEFAPVDRQVTMVQRYLDGADHGYPLFVWVHVFEPHEPYEPPPAFARGSSPRERYDGEVAAADHGVGALIAAFRRARPGTTVIVSADHGEEHGEHGGHHHGTTLFDEQIRIPLIWSSPGRVPPHVIDTPAELVDIPTTLLSALGIPREARMRGDDFSPELAGAPAAAAGSAPRYAFALIDNGRMATDGRRKLICSARDCQLFDLREDPRERRDLVDEQPGEVGRLRHALEEFLAATPRLEALALGNGGAWPEALTRGRLGDASVALELVPLLSSPRTEVRAEAARLLGELGAASARTVLSGMRRNDREASVRAEAALSALQLGEMDAREQVVALLGEHRDDSGLVRRAALALAAVDDASGERELVALAADTAADEPQRLAALRALAQVGSKASAGPLAELLESVRLRPEVAKTLGAIGDRRSVRALQAALQVERYPEARSAEARALLALGARAQAIRSLRRFLGTESSLPDGVALLLEAGALARPSGSGADLRAHSPVQRGDWACEAHGCRPLAGAEIALPAQGAPKAAARVIVRVHVEGAARTLRLAGNVESLDGGEHEIARGLADARKLVLPVEAGEGVWLQAIAVVPVSEDVPPPEPEPWQPADGGVDAGADSGSQ